MNAIVRMRSFMKGNVTLEIEWNHDNSIIETYFSTNLRYYALHLDQQCSKNLIRVKLRSIKLDPDWSEENTPISWNSKYKNVQVMFPIIKEIGNLIFEIHALLQ